MLRNSAGFIILLCAATIFQVAGQDIKLQQAMVLKAGTNIRLGNVEVLNKRSRIITKSTLVGTFSIAASAGDTLEISSPGYQNKFFVITDFADQVLYLRPATELQEVVIKATSTAQDLADTQLGYRRQGVFYTGEPHYYYLFLKPFTFIYENFKSEVKNARRFKKYARQELSSLEVAKRFNNALIKQTVPVTDNELDIFKLEYEPTVEQIRKWSDYDLIIYIRKCYGEFRKREDNKS